jgi:hypothetical protein
MEESGMKLKGILILVLLAVVAAVPAMAQQSQLVRVPVAGEYFDQGVGGEVAYHGALHHVWTPTADGSGWDVTSILVADAWLKATGNRLALFGVSQQNVAGSPGEVVDLKQAITVVRVGGFSVGEVAFNLGAELPHLAAVPAERPIAVQTASRALLQASVPVQGNYYEPAIGGEVGYEGVVTMTWTPPPAGTDNWTVNGTLVARAVNRRTGESYVYLGVCQDCLAMASGSSLEMNRPVWAFVAGGSVGYQGSLVVTLALPAGASFPQVSSAALASR